MPTPLHRLPVEYMSRQSTQRTDGRRFDFYSFAAKAPRPAATTAKPSVRLPSAAGLRELRWHPLLGTWNLVTGDRHLRPTMPDGCPFCPGGAEDLADFALAAFDNRFPALVSDPPAPDSGPFPAGRRPARGRSEVIVYSPVHEGRFATLSPDAVLRLVRVWADRQRHAEEDPEVEFVFPFENRGEDAGNTLTHPHGQLFAFPFLPPRVLDKVQALTAFRERHHDCLMCAVQRMEAAGARMLYSGQQVNVYVPDFARFPFETHVSVSTHGQRSLALSDAAAREFAACLLAVSQALDSLFGEPMPGMMCLFPAPRQAGEDWHLHAEFLPLMRKAGRLKRLAAVESGTGAMVVDESPEEMAKALGAVFPELAWPEITVHPIDD